jgi:hypothetical protein
MAIVPPNQPNETEADFLKRLAIDVPDPAGVTYDADRMNAALQRFAAGGLLADDIKLLTLIDARLGVRAKARQAGYVDRDLDDPRSSPPLSTKAFLAFGRDHLAPLLATFRYKANALTQDLAAVFARLQASETDRAQLRDQIARLESRLLELEADRAAKEPADAVER